MVASTNNASSVETSSTFAYNSTFTRSASPVLMALSRVDFRKTKGWSLLVTPPLVGSQRIVT